MAQQCVNNALVSDSYPTRIRIVSCLLFSTLIKASLKLEQPERNSQALSFRHENKEWNTVFLMYNQFSWGQLRSPAYRASTTQRAWNLTQSLQTMMRPAPILLLSFSEPVKTDATWVGNLSGSSGVWFSRDHDHASGSCSSWIIYYKL
jgi:hypothetical protein